MSEHEIRKAITSDLSALIELWDELSSYYASLHATYPSTWVRPSSEAHRRKRLLELLSDPEDMVGFIGEVRGSLAGFCRVELTPDGPASAAIHTLVVRPTFQKTGLGKALMLSAFNWSIDHGAVDVALDVLPANVNAAGFHESLGFQPFLTSYVKRLAEPPALVEEDP